MPNNADGFGVKGDCDKVEAKLKGGRKWTGVNVVAKNPDGTYKVQYTSKSRPHDIKAGIPGPST